MINQFYIDYIKAIENPDRVGWNGKVWTAPQYKGYDKNQRGYGIDIVKNDSAKRLTQNRPGQWLTEGEADKLMREHLLYVYGAALKHIEGFDNLSDRRKAALLGMLYRGDSVNKNRHIIDINEPDDNKFFESISNYYKSKGLNERARNSSNFFNNQLTNFLIPMKWEQWEPPMKFKNGGQVRKMQTASGGPIYEEDWSDKLEPYAASVGLAGDVVGLGAAATGVGIPVGTTIAGFANIPNLIIDGYQTARDAWRSYKDNGASLGSAAWNGGEFILDAAGLKALQYINKATKAGVTSEKYLTSTEKALDSKPWKRVGTGHGRVRARQSANHKRKYNSRRNKALEESNIELAKRGVRPALGLYYQQKLTDEMAKRGYGVAVNDAIRSANRTLRQNLGTISGVSGGTNVYHLLPKRKSGGLIRKMLTASGGPLKKPRIKLNGLWRELNYEGNGDFSTLTEKGKMFFTTGKKSPKSIVGNKEIVVTPEQTTILEKLDNTKNYYSAYNPDDIIKGFNALTLGGLNNLSPTQWARRIYDTGKLLSGNMTWSGYTNSWLNGNNGLVSLKFSEEHPYLSTGINLVGDAAALGGISGIKKLTNISKPNTSVTANVGTSVEQKIPALSLEEIQKAYEGARQWHLNRINSEAWKARASKAGFTDEEIPQLLKQLSDQIRRLPLTTGESVFGKNASIVSNAGNAKVAASYMQSYDPVTKQIKMGISLGSPNISFNDAFRNFVHEFGHGATFGLNGTETSGAKGLLANKFPLINRLVKYNKSLYPEVSEKSVSEALPEVSKYWASQAADNPKLLSYFAEPTEMLSRGYEFLLNSAVAKNTLKKTMNIEPTDLEVMDKAVEYGGSNSNIFRKLAGELGASNFIHNALGISAPLGLGGYGLYNNDNYLQQLQYLKQGGKMNILEFLKNGSGIHIKEKNRGKFTSYCGGKVTDECILKGKNSSNPAIRKRATFAANARKWKRKEGGIIKATKGTAFKLTVSNALGKVGNFLNSDWGKLAASGISSMFGGGNSEPSYNNNYSDIMTNTALLYMLNQLLENEVLNNYDKIMSKLHFDPSNPNANGGSIVKNHVNYLAQAPVIAGLKEFNDNYKKFLDEQAKYRKTNYITNALTNTLLTGFDLALNYKPTTKKGSSVS